MKKSNIAKFTLAAALACATGVACVAFAGCGKNASVECVGTYKEYMTTNHNTSQGDMELGYQHEYTLEVYSDNTYKMEYSAFYCISQWQGSSNRTVIQYGTYTTAESTEEGTAVYELSKPSRIIFFAMCGGYNGIPTSTIAYADTANWDKVSPTSEEGGHFIYTLTARSLTEEYTSAEQLINTVGRSYKVTCQTGEFHRMEVEVVSHKGKNINGYDNIIPLDAWVD